MFFPNGRLLRGIALILLFASLASASGSLFGQSGKQRNVGKPGISAHNDDEGKKRKLTREQLAREAWVWHESNRVRIEKTAAMGGQRSAQIINNDINDISVIQGNNQLISSPNPFDLSQRAVLFSRSGGGYLVTTPTASFDANLGAKLNFTAAPAVNPKSAADPGDDAYIIQDFGFNFSYFGATYSNIAISTNGNLTFRPANISQIEFDAGAVSSIATLTELQRGLPRIAPYWHDLDARAAQTTGADGIYFRRDADRVVITWNNVRDFPNEPAVDRGIHQFQATIFSNGAILFTYGNVQLTSQALTGIAPGNDSVAPTLTGFNPLTINESQNAICEFFSTSTKVDYIGAIKAFYETHPNRDVYDFIYFITDFNFDLGGGAFAFFQLIRNEAEGIGVGQFNDDPGNTLGSQKIQGILNLSNLASGTGVYPESPVTRFLGANHALSILGQEQGHRWLAFVGYPGNQTLLLGRDDAHWSFFLNIESTISSPAARRSSSAEGSVWRDNNDGTFTSLNLVDGFSRLDHYLMGLRPASAVPDTFVIANPFNTARTRESAPRPNSIVSGTRQTVSINQIIQANNARTPDPSTAQKSFRAAVVLLTQPGSQPSAATLNKITTYRLAWESYFSQSTDFLATINTGLADQTQSRVIAAASAGSYKSTLAAGEIAALFGEGLASGVEAATSQPLPTTLAGTQVRVNGTPAPLFFASPTQINFQVPRAAATTTINPAVSSSTALIEVIFNGQLIRAGAFQIAPVVPAIFTLSQNGAGAAAALDGVTGAPAPFNAKQSNGQPNVIAVFGTGFGTDATDIDGDVNASVQATIDGSPVTVSYAGRAPGFTGLNQINLFFPANIASGNHTLIISRNGIQSQAVTIAVR